MKFGKKQILSAVFILAFGAVAVFAGLYAGNTKGTADTAEVSALPEAAADDKTENATLPVGDSDSGRTGIDFEELKAQNPDIYAWISIPGTQIDYPVLQKSDAEDPYDNYYLDHQVDLSEGLPGVIYSQPVNRRDFTDPVTVLYGHNMKNGEMFSGLHFFDEKDFFDRNSQVIIYTPEKTFTYEIFGAVDFSDALLTYEYDFTKNAEVQRYLTDTEKCEGNFRKETELSEGDKILVLSTCYSGREERRLLVEAVLTSVLESAPEETGMTE